LFSGGFYYVYLLFNQEIERMETTRVISRHLEIIHGEIVEVKILAPAGYHKTMTKARFQKTGSRSGERHMARENDQFKK